MPIILAPRPLSDEDKKDELKGSNESLEDLSLKITSTDLTGRVPEQEADGHDDVDQAEASDEKTQGKMPKIMTNTVYDI